MNCDVWNIILPIVSLFLGKPKDHRVALTNGVRAMVFTLFPIPNLGDGTCCLVPPSREWLILVPHPLLSIRRPQFQQYVLTGLKQYRKEADLVFERYEQDFKNVHDWFVHSYRLIDPQDASDVKYDRYDELNEEYWLSYYVLEDEHDEEQDRLEEQYATALAYSRVANRQATHAARIATA